MPRDRKPMTKRTDRKRGPRRGGARSFVLRKKKCRFCTDKNLKISHLDQQLLRRLTTERGKIIPSRFSGTCAKHQRKVSKAIKRARNIGLVPFLAE